MPPKKNANKKKQDDDDDWEAILQAEKAANAAAQPAPAPIVEQAKAPAEEDDSDSDDDDAGGKKDKDKRKKKKKTKKEKEEAAAAKKTTAPSAAAKAALLHQQKFAEEQARLKKLQEEEELRIKLEEERLEAEKRAIEEEKERKRKAKQDKIDAQKAAGTYMTKGEKERQKKAQARLEAMKAAGMLNVPGLVNNNNEEQDEAASPTPATSSVSYFYGKKNKNAKKTQQEEAAEQAALAKQQEEEEEESEEPTQEEDEADDWEANLGEDWEDNLDQIDINADARKTALQDDVEDLIELEKKKEQEKLKQLGLERLKREEELRLKREEEERLRSEMEKKEAEAAMKKELSRKNRLLRDEQARAARSPTNLRSPISCIMGHVDTGKTKLLDKIRHTNVQEGEAGGITQQIGATQFSKETLALQTQCMQETAPFDINIPGLLVIDTPGHESFTNLRSRGSSLCDIAILVIDLMHGLEPQTIESINLLRRKKTPFIVALNKVDRCYGWKTMPDSPIRTALAAQDENVHYEFKDRYERIVVQLMELGMNAKLYWENDDLAHTVSLVPTSAVTGEGVPDLLRMLITLSQTMLREQLMYMEMLQCTVLEVKVIEGLGHTVDVVLVNGTLHEGDTIVVSTMDGPVVTNIRALLTPPPNREMRIKSEYVHHEKLSGAIGIKIVAPEIGRAIAGTPILVVHPEDDLEDVKEDVQSDLAKVMKTLETDNQGVMVHASTLGALEALLQFLREECKPPIPVNYVNIGPIHKKDVMRASIMHEKKLPEYATILAFDVPIDAEAREMAEELNVRIFTAEIIYHLFDQFTAYMRNLREAKKQAAMNVVVFPVVLRILPEYVFNKKDPIVLGVEVVEGTLKLNTPLVIMGPQTDIGKVTRLEINHKEVNTAKKGTQVAVRIVNESNPTITYGRQFDHTNTLYSKISRESIDACKEYFKEELTKDDWALTIKLKKIFSIP